MAVGATISLCYLSKYTAGFVTIPNQRFSDCSPPFWQQHDTNGIWYPQSNFVLYDSNSDSTNDDDKGDENIDMMDQVLRRQESIDVEKVREQLERDNMRKLLSRKPIKLPYEVARRFVQANLGANTKEEFFDLVANGNLRTPYIPKNPERYYTSTREWISWDHFLKGLFDDEKPSSIRPASGIFD
jgi:hypothetical protein